MDFYNDPVKQIEDALRVWQHQMWGFVIYRSTYTSEEDFAAFIESMKASAAENLKSEGADGRPIAQQLSWKIVEDRVSLEGATKPAVRKIFNEWHQSADAAAEQPETIAPLAMTENARYKFCVLIDEASLDSFRSGQDPWVNLILRRWPYWPEEDEEEEEEDEEVDEDDLEFEEIEGSWEEDVGWCKVRAFSLLPVAFGCLCYLNAWYKVYQRPPAVVG